MLRLIFLPNSFLKYPKSIFIIFCVIISSRTYMNSLYFVFYMLIISSVTLSCLTLCDPMDCNTPGLPVHQQLSEFTQTHVHWVGDAIQPSHPLLSPSPPAFSLSQHQGLFQWVSSLHQVAKVLELQLQHQSCQWIFKVDFQDWTGLISLLSKGLSRVFFQHHSSKASILWRSTFLMVQHLTSIRHYWKNHSFDYMDFCWQSNVSAF